MRRLHLVAALLAALSLLVVGMASAGAKPAKRPAEAETAAKTASKRLGGDDARHSQRRNRHGFEGADRVIMFAADGMRHDFVERYADSGSMPTLKRMIKKGVKAEHGLLQGFPPNTGVGWHTLATGAWPGEHGSTNNTFHRTGASFTGRTSFAEAGILQADHIAQAAERAGKEVASVEWVATRSLNPAVRGPVVDFRSFFSSRGILVSYDMPGQPAGANAFGVQYQRGDLELASGWTNVPRSYSRPKQQTFDVNSSAVANDRFDVYIYDSTDDGRGNYDGVLIVPNAAGKDGSQAVADLGPGEWADIKVKLNDGRTVGFYVKIVELNRVATRFRLYFTSFARANATYLDCPCASTFEETLNARFPSSTAADFAPLEAGIIDEDTYVEQGLKWKDAHWAYLRYILGDDPVPTVSGGPLMGLGFTPDLMLAGNPVTDEFQHQFLALVTERDMDRRRNPYFDDVNGDGVRDHRVEEREEYLRQAYEEADGTLGLVRYLLGARGGKKGSWTHQWKGDEKPKKGEKADVATFALSDHGFAPQWYAVNARKVLFDQQVSWTSPATSTTPATPMTGSLHASGANTTSNCGAAATDIAKACWAGGTIQIYVNPTLPAGLSYEAVRTAAIAAFATLQDPANPGKQVVQKIFRKEELRDVDGSDSLHPNRSGDVVVVLRPPYQSDAATPGVRIAFSHFFGQHGYLPNLVSGIGNVDMHGSFFAEGAGIEHRTLPGTVPAVDVAPSAAALLGIPGPQNARGNILYDALSTDGILREITILDISDWHGQLPPLSEAADSVGPTFAIGGAAFLKPWFDLYRARARHGSVEIAAGDTVGATPPISAAFGDTPAIEAMNLMGMDADGLGNHNFDRGEQYLRTVLIPLADYPHLSSNIVFPAGGTPPEWSPSAVFTFGGARLALIGFSNTDIPTLTTPGSLGPFVVTDPVAAINAERARLGRSVDAAVAMGHLGATTGTLNPLGVSTSPGGPLIDLADAARGFDAVVGDHTDLQVLDTRPNGVLVTENRSKGLRFTRLRLVVDRRAGAVVYKTADFHKPWAIGMTPDPAIQAKIDDFNAQLAPVLGRVIGSSTTPIPRADACGQSAGRTCESKVGNVVTDAMRKTYGVEVAITNSGGLRADLTCPTTDNPNDFCPPYTAPPFLITRGQVLGVLPFGNQVVTGTITGSELKLMLENGVSRMPAVDGRFPQVSGLCFTYDISRPVGDRVLSAVRADANGACTATPLDLTALTSYSFAENDFMSRGGDGYPDFSARVTTRDLMDQVTADYVAGNSPISPAIQGRINCVGAACPTVTP